MGITSLATLPPERAITRIRRALVSIHFVLLGRILLVRSLLAPSPVPSFLSFRVRFVTDTLPVYLTAGETPYLIVAGGHGRSGDKVAFTREHRLCVEFEYAVKM